MCNANYARNSIVKIAAGEREFFLNPSIRTLGFAARNVISNILGFLITRYLAYEIEIL
jgi:hypothetical protein